MDSSWFNKVICRFKDDYLFVRVYGNGKKNLLAFHGYAQNGKIFEALGRQNKYTIYSFDLFFHGHSSSPNTEEPIDHDAFKFFLDDFFKQTAIKKCDVMAFSMGGKYALSLAKTFPYLIDNLILIAPDGVEKNFWYSLATGSALTRKIFKYMPHHPNSFFKIALLLEKSKIIDGRVRKFALSQMDTLEKRENVYSSWIYLRNFFVPKSEISKIITFYKINLKIVIGKYDRIITRKSVKRLLKKVGPDKLHIVNSGHTNILKNYIAIFLED